jgi:hypothetical protein
LARAQQRRAWSGEGMAAGAWWLATLEGGSYEIE